jgi:hypothetical protein
MCGLFSDPKVTNNVALQAVTNIEVEGKWKKTVMA